MSAIYLLLWALTVKGDTTIRNTRGVEQSIDGGMRTVEAQVLMTPTEEKKADHKKMDSYARGKRDNTQVYAGSRKSIARPRGLSGSWPYECDELLEIKCNPFQKYRTFDGSCNNLKNPSWGQTRTCRDRLLPADYADGKWEIRVSRKSRKPLPNPRILSLELNNIGPKNEDAISHMVMQFGKLISEDVTASASNFPSVNCCSSDVVNERCNPVPLPKNDPFYSKLKLTCHNFMRRPQCQYCTNGSAQYSNEVTGFIDGSFIYGSDEVLATSLRGEDGLLAIQNDPTSGELLPASGNPESDGCSIPERNLICFKTGRTFITLPSDAGAFTIFLRQHNRLARGLKIMNPTWENDKVYHEARRILAAQLQMITYNEFLPVILGIERMKSASLLPLESGRTVYEPQTNPTILQEFNLAAYRSGHPQIQSFFSEYPKKGNIQGRYLRDMFGLAFAIHHGELEPLITGLLFDPSLKVSTYYVPDVTNYLFGDRNSTGEDLKLRDILRGRDLGLSPYTDYVRVCGGPKIQKFEDLDKVMPKYMRMKFAKLYESVEDIDLLLAGLAEYPFAGGLVGRTFNCILTKQFYHLKFGDRFYFEHGKQIGSFTDGQLKEIKKTSLAKMICEVTNINEIQPDVMHLPSKENPVVDCYRIPEMDLSKWKEY